MSIVLPVYSCPPSNQPTLNCSCPECVQWRRAALAHWAMAKEEHNNAIVFLQPKGSCAAYALLQDARAINATCGHMIRTDTFGVPDVFVCDIAGVAKTMRRHGHKTVLVRESWWSGSCPVRQTA